nr:MAG TPA: hypothetical protein [Caudoviricetes sp.]DAW81263.1 MAG TPA: hypothetical protein [Caudoviricetes sp.]DAY41491.1 MAG TPA: hypothetical protein [Caudoviricetes sp.]
MIYIDFNQLIFKITSKIPAIQIINLISSSLNALMSLC